MKAKHLTKETIVDLGMYDRSFPDFKVGDTIAVAQRIKEGKEGDKEGEKERIQLFEGDVIAIHKNGSSSTFTVRKMSANGISVERIFPYFSPIIESITKKKVGDVRRAKLYYLRGRVGKAARVKERILTREEKELLASKTAAAEEK